MNYYSRHDAYRKETPISDEKKTVSVSDNGRLTHITYHDRLSMEPQPLNICDLALRSHPECEAHFNDGETILGRLWLRNEEAMIGEGSEARRVASTRGHMNSSVTYFKVLREGWEVAGCAGMDIAAYRDEDGWWMGSNGPLDTEDFLDHAYRMGASYSDVLSDRYGFYDLWWSASRLKDNTEGRHGRLASGITSLIIKGMCSEVTAGSIQTVDDNGEHSFSITSNPFVEDGQIYMSSPIVPTMKWRIGDVDGLDEAVSHIRLKSKPFYHSDPIIMEKSTGKTWVQVRPTKGNLDVLNITWANKEGVLKNTLEMDYSTFERHPLVLKEIEFLEKIESWKKMPMKIR